MNTTTRGNRIGMVIVLAAFVAAGIGGYLYSPSSSWAEIGLHCSFVLGFEGVLLAFAVPIWFFFSQRHNH